MKAKILVLSLVAAGAAAAGVAAVDSSRRAEPPVLPQETRQGYVYELLCASPFTLAESYAHDWRRERPQVHAGYMLVLSVDPEIVYPRQGPQPVLYVGDQTAERVNHGDRSGRVIAIVPAAEGQLSPDEMDLAAMPIWFGAPELPERIDLLALSRERDVARMRGVQPFAPEAVEAALECGETLALADKVELLERAADWIEVHSPAERGLATDLRNQRP